MSSEPEREAGKGGASTARFAGWAAVGAIFMVGCIAPVGKVMWVAAALLAVVLLLAGARSPRFLFALAAGIGATLVALAIANPDYLPMALYGLVLIAGGVVAFAAFGPRASHAEAP